MKLRNFLIAGVAGAMAIATAAPAGAATKFGADLDGGPQPQNAAQDCGDTSPPLDPGDQCTRVPYKFDQTGAISGNTKAPKDGTIDKLKLIAQQPGKFTFQLAKLKDLNSNNGTGKADITRSGGKIEYDASDSKRGGGYEIQTFNVDVTVKKNEYMAFKAKEFSAQSCNNGTKRQLVFQPPPSVSAGFSSADANENCNALVQAIYE